jgi:hypothetical protein
MASRLLRNFSSSLPVTALLVAVTVHAQNSPAPAPATTTAPAAVVQVKLSGSEMIERMGTMQTEMQNTVQHVVHLQMVARRDKDMLKLSCVNDKLVEIKAQLNIFDSTQTTFQAELAHSTDAARVPFGEMTDIAVKVKGLRQDADACIGVPGLAKQESGVDVQHPAFPDDPTVNPSGNAWGIEPPAYASPFN